MLLQAILYLVDLLQDKNKEVRRTADICLDLIMDSDKDWAEKIRSLKFGAFNQEWLEAVDTSTVIPMEKTKSQVLHLHYQDDEGSSEGDVEFDTASQQCFSKQFHRYE